MIPSINHRSEHICVLLNDTQLTADCWSAVDPDEGQRAYEAFKQIRELADEAMNRILMKLTFHRFPEIADEARGPYDNQMFSTDVDEDNFRDYARENDPPATWEECKILHPFCRDEWFKRGVLPTA